jgi:hypothetical protein
MTVDAVEPSPSQSGPTSRKPIGDSIAIWPFVLACILPIMLVLVWSGPFDLAMLGAPIVLVIWANAALFALVFAIFSAIERGWRRTVSMLILPLMSLAALLNFGPLWSFAMDTGKKIHFQFMRASYLAQIAKLPADQGPRLAVFNWGGFVVSHGVVYDESDEIVVPPIKQSPEWNKRIVGTELECGFSGYALGDHFYMVHIYC